MTINDNDNGLYKFETKNYTDFNKILGYSLSGIDNHAKKQLKGETGVGYSFTEKKFKRVPYTYNDGVSDFTLLGRRSLFRDISNANADVEFFGEPEEVIKNIQQNN
jgi:hypothetical protein